MFTTLEIVLELALWYSLMGMYMCVFMIIDTLEDMKPEELRKILKERKRKCARQYRA